MAKELTYKDIIKNREYRKLLFTNLINRFGDSVDAIAFTWLVYQITHSASWSALIFGLNVLPNIIVQPFSGALVEKMDKKKVIVGTHILRGLVISGFVAMYLMGVVNPIMMAVFTLAITTIESFNLPASTAFIPTVIRKEHLTHAMSLNSTLSNTVALIGTGLAGIIIAKFGVYTAMLIDAATFFMAAIGTWSLKTTTPEVPATEASETVQAVPAAKESYLSLLRGGFDYVKKSRVILNYCLIAIVLNFLLVPLNSLQAPIVEDVFKMGSELLSVMGMAAAIGAIIGSALVPMFAEKMSAKQILVTCGIALGAGMYLITLGKYTNGAAIPGYLLTALSFMIMMCSASIIGGTLSIQFVKSVDASFLARAAAVFNASSSAATPLGSLLISFAALKLSAATLIGGSAVLAILLFVLVAFSHMNFELKEELPDAT